MDVLMSHGEELAVWHSRGRVELRHDRAGDGLQLYHLGQSAIGPDGKGGQGTVGKVNSFVQAVEDTVVVIQHQPRRVGATVSGLGDCFQLILSLGGLGQGQGGHGACIRGSVESGGNGGGCSEKEGHNTEFHRDRDTQLVSLQQEQCSLISNRSSLALAEELRGGICQRPG